MIMPGMVDVLAVELAISEVASGTFEVNESISVMSATMVVPGAAVVLATAGVVVAAAVVVVVVLASVNINGEKKFK